MIKKIFSSLISLFSLTSALACTSFGFITNEGLVISKNRDYLYNPQQFQYVSPLKQFEGWFGNSYQHNFPFYALMAENDVKFGVNEAGLVAIEEDPMPPKDASSHRKFIQPYSGYAEGMVLYGVLENFASVKELMPFIDQIFSVAAPNFYQIADTHSILTVEVGYGESDNAPLRPYTYSVLKTPGGYFTHTNTYLSTEFQSLNNLSTSKDNIRGSNYRLKKITQYIESSQNDFSHALDWYLDTSSKVGSLSLTKPKYCQNTSLFRSYLKTLRSVNPNTDSTTNYGTVSSFVVEHQGKKSLVHIRIIESIDTLENDDQKITYKDLSMPLDQLFHTHHLSYTTHSFIRPAPVNTICNKSDITRN